MRELCPVKIDGPRTQYALGQRRPLGWWHWRHWRMGRLRLPILLCSGMRAWPLVALLAAADLDSKVNLLSLR